MELGPYYAAISKRKQSGESRRQDRKRLGAIAAHGEVAFTLPTGRQQTAEALHVLLHQQEARLAEHGIRGVFGTAERAFVARLAELQPPRRAVLLPYTLSCGDEVLAVMLCARHGETLWGLISSMAQTALRRYSPGDLALRRCIEAGCASGLTHFDFASGDTAYKRTWADYVMPLHEHHSGRNLRGITAAAMLMLVATLKRMIKQWPPARSVFLRVRKALRGKPQP